MRVLLTGSTGWLGRHLAPMLRDAGHQVVGMDVAPGPDTRVVGSVADHVLHHASCPVLVVPRGAAVADAPQGAAEHTTVNAS